MTEDDARAAVVEAVRRLDALGLNRGSTGNASHRWDQGGQRGMLITPTGMGAELTADDLVHVADDGTVSGRWQPSSEWQFHRAAYRARPDVRAVLHTHAVHATALACLGRPLPPFHYMVAVAGGDDVPLVPYSTFGSEALSAGVANALAHRQACLLAHHGLVACGATMAQAMKVMVEVESLCQTYLLALAAGEPARLPPEEMDRVLDKFRHYGQHSRRVP
ncbi:class II aldolase/adducin family protein [Rubrivivax albus]|uniref:Class II aldolase n=1 Tax=Rubrivivax albus TaxID=2499835 RepID=A0A3S2WXJ4_9BURK|nr:class II aldolase/adducin family protein [Rubrivivax albus]RVT48362.1 class II aldolase [Rubrivivax albus]